MVISNYSVILGPVTQSLQAMQLDLLSVQKKKNLNLLLTFSVGMVRMLKFISNKIYFLNAKLVALAQSINIDMKVPRECGMQVCRSNPGCSNNNREEREPEDYFRKTLFVPYLDSII